MRIRYTIAVGVAALALLLAGCTQPAADQEWEDYPAHANLPADTVLQGPDEAETIGRAADLLQQARDKLTAKLGNDSWVEQHAAQWQDFGGNGYGGKSLLAAYIAPVWEMRIEVPPNEWDDLIEVVQEVAAANRLSPLDLDERAPSGWMSLGSFHDELGYLEIIVQDARLNKEELKLAEANDLIVAGIVLSSGGTTIHDADREAFMVATKPFEGKKLPPATSAD